MQYQHTPAALLLSALAAASAGAACADVTIEQQTSFDVAIIKAHGTATEYTTADKQRRDTALNCEGFMSMLCGNAQTGEIIRLDRDVTWTLEPKKQEYRERPFLTAAQRQAAEQQARATMEKMKQCPALHNTTAGPDTSKCQMSAPKLDVKQTGSHATFAGHDAQLTQLALTQSCSNPQTGDVCDFVFTLDSWLTQDQIAGLEDRKAFQEAYRRKLGLDDPNSPMQKQMTQFLAPYAASLKELSSKVGDLKGYPLKTAMRIAFGGEHCAAAKQQGQSAGGGSDNAVADAGQAAGNAATGSAAGAAGSAAGNAATNAAGSSAGGSVLGSAASAFSSKLVSGLFAKKKSDSANGSSGSGGAAGGTPGGGLPPGMVQAAQVTVETTSITPGAIPPARFDIPAGWKLVQPPPAKEPKEFTCPKSGA
jgi:hypothetical protein